MKKVNYMLFLFISFIVFSPNVFAANSFAISAPSSVTAGTKYTVSINYNGSQSVGSMGLRVNITNAECSIASNHSSGLPNCNGAICQVSYTDTVGIKSGTNLLKLSCTSSGSKATFRASLDGDDAWDVEGLEQISISSASKSITVNAKSTTSKKTTTTTKTTTTKRPTTKATTAPTQKTTLSTTKKTENTTKNITQPTTYKVPITDVTTSSSTTTTMTTTEETTSTSTIYIPDDMKLSELKIVGYDIDFKPNCSRYSVNVSEDVDELYVIATPSDEKTKIENIGVVDIEGKKEIVIRVFNESSKHEVSYKIEINKIKSGGVISIRSLIINNVKIITVIVAILLVLIIVAYSIAHKFSKSTHSLDVIDNIEYDHNDNVLDTHVSEVMSSVSNVGEFYDRNLDDINNNIYNTENVNNNVMNNANVSSNNDQSDIQNLLNELSDENKQ